MQSLGLPTVYLRSRVNLIGEHAYNSDGLLMPIETRHAQVQASLDELRAGRALTTTEMSTALDLAKDAMSAGRPELAIAVLEPLTRHAATDARAWQLLGFAYRDEQRMPEAAQAFAHGADLDPHDPLSAAGAAQSTCESGLPAARLFRRALELAPDYLGAIGGAATALIAEAQAGAAEALLADALTRLPHWLEGHRQLAALRWTSGDTRHFARSYAEACRVQPHNRALRLAWFRAIAQTRDWEAARTIVEDGEKIFGNAAAFNVARLFIASESGDRGRAEELFALTASIRDEVRDLAYIRHCLRTGQLDPAERLALHYVETASAAAIWPYLSLIWRLRGDVRAAWLDGAPPYVHITDLDVSVTELAELAVLLRQQHTARAPYLEQSVRGGTQTDGQLFFRGEPAIQSLKAKMQTAIRDYVAVLPRPVRAHPLLGTARAARGPYLFAGSWSVRLEAQGFHVSHTHPQGWISSAFYVALPEAAQLGASPSGWIRFGVPPRELGLDLPAYLHVEPKPGRLVLFPSTMWHATVPFNDGERLVVAFDVLAPRR